uniref:KIB1-4 beta-propeller domain-containing protein n=1 Tax=Fagus sylvatica TaxID=28930 RepID=A0A2N9F8U2_FAGSY
MKKKSARREEQHRPPPPEPYPWLLYSYDAGNKTQLFCSILNTKETYSRRIPELRNRALWATYHGWCLYSGSERRHILWNPVTLEKITLPRVPEYDIDYCIWTCAPSEPGCLVVLFTNCTCILYCEIGDEIWTSYPYYDELKRSLQEGGQWALAEMEEEYPLLIQPVWCGGNLYAIVLSDYDHWESVPLVKIDIQWRDSFKIESLNVCLPSTTPVIGAAKRIYLMESCGDLFTVEIQAKHESGIALQVIAIEIHRLSFSKKEWLKVETAKDRAFFLPMGVSDQAISSPAINPDIANRVYFTLFDEKNLYSYNIEEGTVSVFSSFPNLPRVLPCSPVWVMPDLRFTNTLEEVKDKSNTGKENDLKVDAEDIDDTSELHLSDLPFDMVKVIAERLILVDYLHFRATCKIFHSAPPSIQWRIALQMRVENPSLLSPWLVFFEKQSVCTLIDPIHGDKYHINLPQELKGGCIVCGSKVGWLLVAVGEKSTFFFNPFTQVILPLAELSGDKPRNFSCIGFSSSPISSECVVIEFDKHMSLEESGGDEFVLESSRLGEDHWDTNFFDDDDFFFNDNSPVFYRGAFYCLGKKGNLGLLKLNDEEEYTWKVLTQPKPPCLSGYHQNFLVECDGELLSVFVGCLGKWIQVFKLNESKMTWIGVESLGNYMLYLSCSSSLAVMAKNSGMENKIYFPIFCGESMVFFSLETKKFHSFESKDVAIDFL